MTLHVEDLRVYYRGLRGEVRAVDGVSFDVADGEILGLAGESGCGKSSLGNSLVYLSPRMRYVGGKAELDGELLPLWDEAAMRAFRFEHISTVPQYAMSALSPTKRVATFISDMLKTKGRRYRDVYPELSRRLEVVGLEPGVLERYPIELSGGMKQRVVLVISTLLDPSLLVADEITSALDVSTQKAVARMLVDFRHRGFVKSTIVITHDLAVLHAISDSILVMYAGRLAERAPAQDLVERAFHPYTRMLLGSLPEVGARYTARPLSGIKGQPPSLLDPAPGCRFAARCPFASEVCEKSPEFEEVAPGRWVACWAWREVSDSGS